MASASPGDMIDLVEVDEGLHHVDVLLVHVDVRHGVVEEVLRFCLRLVSLGTFLLGRYASCSAHPLNFT